MVSKVNTVGLWGLDGYAVEVETDARPSQESVIEIVGLPDAAIKESRDRIVSAMRNGGYRLPGARIILNLAPADIKKEGSLFDLPMLLGILSSTGQIPILPEKAAFIGELSLSGDIRRGTGVLASVIAAKSLGFTDIFVPEENAFEGAVIKGINVYPVKNYLSVIKHIEGEHLIEPLKRDISDMVKVRNDGNDFKYIIGQQSAKRACEIAAAGGHNILFIGPPGTGKSMIAKALPSILPDMTFNEIIESSRIYSIAGKLTPDEPLCVNRPFVKSNQNVSVAGLTGGGSIPGPGLISLAHNGVLFLDEIAEFPTKVLESLRQPLEDNVVSVNRVKKSINFPASFMLVCAMNPCPCGYFGHPTMTCHCTDQQIDKYIGKISGPLMDRIDLQVSLSPVAVSDIKGRTDGESSEIIKERVNEARIRQQKRFNGMNFSCNAKMSPQAINETCKLSASATDFLNLIFEKGDMSMRAYDKVIKIAQTIADLSGSGIIESDHIAEAVYFRTLDKKYKR